MFTGQAPGVVPYNVVYGINFIPKYRDETDWLLPWQVSNQYREDRCDCSSGPLPLFLLSPAATSYDVSRRGTQESREARI